MDGFRTRTLAGIDDLCGLEVAFNRRWRADGNGFIGHGNVFRVSIRIGVDRNRLDVEFAGRGDNPAGNLAAVGDQDFTEHRPGPYIRNTPKRVSSMGALSAAESDRASTSRDLRGSIMPSSQSRAEA